MTPTETRELLTLAAKAARIWQDNSANIGGWECNWPLGWSPLTDHGDRYRLARAVKGNLYFSGTRGCFEIPSDSDEPPIIEHFTPGNDEEEALAIVCAAAEIGRNM